MRKDFTEVLITRPRCGGDGGKSILPKGYHRQMQRLDIEELPCREGGAGRIYGHDRKQSTDLISPLKRFLHKNIGRDWDEVYSEICEHIKVRSAVQSHLRDHVDWLVEIHTVLNKDGTITDSEGHSLFNFYVDPRNNTLQFCQRKRWRPSPKVLDYIPGNDENHQYRQIKGIWYEVWLKPLTKTEYGYGRVYDQILMKNVNDCFSRKCVYTYDLIALYGRPVYAYRKRQLNHQEIKFLLKKIA